eukprot:scaffold216708_cov26-Prasinocladus_malaysianus.AAC.2
MTEMWGAMLLHQGYCFCVDYLKTVLTELSSQEKPWLVYHSSTAALCGVLQRNIGDFACAICEH